MKNDFNGFCLIYDDRIGEGQCVEIVHELMEIKKEEYLSDIKRNIHHDLDNDGIYRICCKCPNAPEEWRE